MGDFCCSKVVQIVFFVLVIFGNGIRKIGYRDGCEKKRVLMVRLKKNVVGWSNALTAVKYIPVETLATT